MTVVVDANLALKWTLPEDYTAEALALAARWAESGEHVIAPPIFRAEVTNALHQSVRLGKLANAAALNSLDFLLASTEIDEPAGLYSGALEIAGELGLGATYDALYLALAEHHTCDMWTADRRLVRAAQRRFPAVRWLGDVSTA